MKYDVVVIGGGPAGMMAAGRASELGAHTILLEKNKFLGIKLMMTGKGRCNITNKTNAQRDIIKHYGPNGNFLHSSLYKFGVDETINFFEQKNLKLKIERGNRVFPVSDKAKDVLRVLENYMSLNKVKIKKNSQVVDILATNNKIKLVVLKNGQEIQGNSFIIATGGKSYPITGSNGDMFKFLKKLGHKITALKPALSPLIMKNEYLFELEGLSLKNIEISIYKNNKKVISKFGEALFTSVGMSGPVILDVSKRVGELFPGKIILKIDFKPALSFSELDKRIQNDFKAQSNRQFRNSLNKLLPRKLIPIIIRLSKINPTKQVNLITRKERNKLLHLLKEFELEVKSLAGFNKSIITSGGVCLNEIDPKTMNSKIISNLYLAGEILDIDGPTGGYNLQVAWSTGYIAGKSVRMIILRI